MEKFNSKEKKVLQVTTSPENCNLKKEKHEQYLFETHNATSATIMKRRNLNVANMQQDFYSFNRLYHHQVQFHIKAKKN